MDLENGSSVDVPEADLRRRSEDEDEEDGTSKSTRGMKRKRVPSSTKETQMPSKPGRGRSGQRSMKSSRKEVQVDDDRTVDLDLDSDGATADDKAEASTKARAARAARREASKKIEQAKEGENGSKNLRKNLRKNGAENGSEKTDKDQNGEETAAEETPKADNQPKQSKKRPRPPPPPSSGAAGSSAWEHVAADEDGTPEYWYNHKTEQSVWTCPQELKPKKKPRPPTEPHPSEKQKGDVEGAPTSMRESRMVNVLSSTEAQSVLLDEIVRNGQRLGTHHRMLEQMAAALVPGYSNTALLSSPGFRRSTRMGQPNSIDRQLMALRHGRAGEIRRQLLPGSAGSASTQSSGSSYRSSYAAFASQQ